MLRLLLEYDSVSHIADVLRTYEPLRACTTRFVVFIHLCALAIKGKKERKKKEKEGHRRNTIAHPRLKAGEDTPQS